MNYICTYFKLLLLFGVSAAFISCEKNNSPEDARGEHEEYFEGKINGQEFEPDGNWNCQDIYGTYYPDGYLDFEGGFLTFTIKDCGSKESLVIGKKSNLHIGVFTSTDTSDTERPLCTFADNNYDFYDQNGQTVVLRANHRLEINLEIINIDYIEEHDDYYIEGLLDAVVQDTIVDSTIVISDVRFGYKF
jgi:hypothetical protein